MNFNLYDPSSGPRLILKRTEPSDLVKGFSKFFCDILPNLYDVKCPKFLEDVKNALKDMRRLKWELELRHQKEFYVDIRYENPSVRCAYMYSYNILNSVIVYHEFSNYLQNNEKVSKRLNAKKTLNICCLAGGPATEAIGVSKAIIDFISKSSSNDALITDIHVTIVDIVEEWKTEGQALINALNTTSKLFNCKRVHFHYSFLHDNIVVPFNKILKAKLKEADIVTVVKFASSIEEKSTTVCISFLQNMIKNVMDSMHERACLFMLDVAGSKIFRNTLDAVSNHPNKCAPVVSLHKRYRLLPKTLQEMESCIQFRNVAKASTLFPTVLTKISSCFWIKKSIKPKKITETVKTENVNSVKHQQDCDNNKSKKKKKKECKKNKAE